MLNGIYLSLKDFNLSFVGLKIYTTVVFPDRDGRICFPAIPWNLLPAHGQGTALLRRNEPVFGKNIIKKRWTF